MQIAYTQNSTDYTVIFAESVEEASEKVLNLFQQYPIENLRVESAMEADEETLEQMGMLEGFKELKERQENFDNQNKIVLN